MRAAEISVDLRRPFVIFLTQSDAQPSVTRPHQRINAIENTLQSRIKLIVVFVILIERHRQNNLIFL